MNIDKFKHQHLDILARIDHLRTLTRAGVIANAGALAQGIVAISAVIKLHLSVEDQALYPALQRSDDAGLARLGQRFQHDMGPIAAAFDAFARRRNTAARLCADEAGFRRDANDVLRRVYERMKHEDRDFYPRIEAAQETAAAQP